MGTIQEYNPIESDTVSLEIKGYRYTWKEEKITDKS